MRLLVEHLLVVNQGHNLIQVNGSLMVPLHSGKGVCQDCPLSGQLYSLGVEPFLFLLQRKLSGLALHGLGTGMVFLAHADNMLLTFTNPAEPGRILKCQTVYSAGSSTRINQTKCSRLLSVCARSRVLAVNQLVASMLWYWLVLLIPPPGFVTKIQRMLIHFTWDKKMHWFMAEVLTVSIEKGGQLLMCLRTQVDLINVCNMTDSCQVFPPSAVAAIIRGRNPHLHQCGFKCLVQEMVVAIGVTRVWDMLAGGDQDWILPQELTNRAAVDVQLAADAINCLLHFSPMCLIFGRGVGRLEDLLMGLLLGLARLAINRSRQRAM
eukprot:g47536.t1